MLRVEMAAAEGMGLQPRVGMDRMVVQTDLEAGRLLRLVGTNSSDMDRTDWSYMTIL